MPIYEENPVDITDGAPSAPVTTTDESVRIVDFTVSTPYCANADEKITAASSESSETAKSSALFQGYASGGAA